MADQCVHSATLSAILCLALLHPAALPPHLLQAAWCRFQNTGPDRILCLLQDAALAVHTQDGDAHLIPLPGRFTGMWPLPQGVLLTVRGGVAWPASLCACIQAAPGGPASAGRQPVVELAAHALGAHTCPSMPLPARPPPPLPMQGAEGQGPCILVHPLENIQRVGVAGGGGGWGEREEVVWSSLEVPFLATFNPVRACTHAEALLARNAHTGCCVSKPSCILCAASLL